MDESSIQCQRLNKECRPSAFHRRQNARKSSLSKTGRLEKKLDDLVTLLRAQSSSHVGDYVELIEELRREPDEDHHHPPPPRSQIKVTRTVSTAEKSIDCGFLNHFSQVGASTSSRDESHIGGQMPNAGSGEPTWSEAEEYLSMFVTQKLPYLPFVYFPPGTTAQHLHSDRPFLWLCIMAVTSKSPSQRRTLCDRIRDTVAQRMVLDCYGRDLDFLLGLLVSNQQVFKKLNMTIYSQFATAVVYDLMLNQAPGGDKPSLLSILQTHPDEDPSPPPARTMDERRAVLGCFLLTSSISLFLEKSDTLRWTPHMDECLHHLSEHPECLNDEILAQQVRFQLINERINITTTAANTPGSYNTGLLSTQSPFRSPLSIYTHTINSQLQQTQSKLTPHSQRYRILNLHHSNTHLTIHESALLKPSSTTQTPNPPSLTTHLHHLESLHACLSATTTWITTFLAIPPAEYAGFPFPIFSQLVRNLAALYRLSVLDDNDDYNSAWDRGLVRRTINLMGVMDRLIGNLGQAAALARLEARGEDENEDENENVFFYSIGKYEAVRLKWGVVFGGGNGSIGDGGGVVDQGQGVQDETRGMHNGLGQSQGQDMGSLGVGYDDWLSEFLDSMVH
ncbi:hypothetical protein AbraIFM66950_008751 [Aspergillus brasiliensis]|nr:hypothetical protein AbraIFM66950_008751 [Aspergillus brasiliensis]